jgi:hypothetical protein
MHRALHQATLQRGVSLRMAKRGTAQDLPGLAFKAVNVAAQPRKRAHAYASHAPLPIYRCSKISDTGQ